jgi:hypothetical protein
MGKYANIGAQLDRIEQDIDAVRRNINDASSNAQHSPGLWTRFPRREFTQDNLTAELEKVLNLSVELGQAQKHLTDHRKNILGIGVKREKEAALLIRIGGIQPRLPAAVKGLHGLSYYYTGLDFDTAFASAGGRRSGVGSQILQFADQVKGTRTSDESVGSGSIHVGPRRRDSGQTPYQSMMEFVAFYRQNLHPAISQAPPRQRSNESAVFANPWEPESSTTAQERARRSAATEETNTAWQPGVSQPLLDSPVESTSGFQFQEDPGQEIVVSDLIEPDPEQLTPATQRVRERQARAAQEREQLLTTVGYSHGQRIG